MEQLELLLLQFLMPENEARRHAEEQIKQLAKDPQLVPALLGQIRAARSPNVRQLAAVLLRKKVSGHWMKLSPQTHDSVKSSLLEGVAVEHSFLVRRAIANVVSIVAKHAVPAGEWPELLPFLLQCSQSAQEDLREVALILFSSLTETIGEILRPHFSTLQSIFANGLRDQQSSRVRVAALKAVGALVGYLQTEQEVLMFRELISPILDISRSCLEKGDEEVAVLTFEILDELVESPAPLLGPAIPVIVHFALEVCSNQNLEANTRQQAIQLISWLSKYKPKTLVKNKIVAPILGVMCQILAEPDHRRNEDEVSADRAAAEVLDTMAMSLPKKHVFPPVLNFAISNSRNADYNYREAAVMSLGVVSEGCFEIMKSRMTDILNLVLEALKDSEQAVRGAASFALGQFAEHLQPEIIEHYERVLPCIFSVLNDSSAEVQEKAYYALAAFCENLGQEILPYLAPLMEKLLDALQSGRRDLQETCMSAIGSAAAASELAFMPHGTKVLELLRNFMALKKDEDLPVRARATELVGIIGLAVGRDNVKHALPSFIDAAIEGFSLDFSELREYTHGFFSNVAEILEEDVVQYLPRVVPLVFASCNLDDGTALDFGDSDSEGEIANGFGGVSSDEDEKDDKRVRNFSVRSGVLDEKAAATQTLGLFALHTKSSFMPYLEDTLVILKKHAVYFHEDVRLQAVISLQHVLTATEAAFPSSRMSITDLSSEVKHVLDTVMDLYLKALNEDDDKDTVAQVCCCMADIIKCQNFTAIEQFLIPLSKAILSLLRQDAICQQSGDTDSEADDDIEHDEVLMDAVTDLLPAIASRMGAAFEPLFRQQFVPLMKFAKPTHPSRDRTMVIACVAEVAREMGPAIMPYVESVMPIAISDLSSTEATNRRNAAFCVGEVCKNGGEKALQYYNNILMALHPLFGEGEEDAVRDNAAGAVARMILTQPQALPLNQVLPVFLSALPLKEDMEESSIVYGCLCNLLLASHPQILPHVPQIISIFTSVVIAEASSAEIKEGIGRTVSHLLSQYRDQMQPLLSNLSPEAASALASVMQNVT